MSPAGRKRMRRENRPRCGWKADGTAAACARVLRCSTAGFVRMGHPQATCCSARRPRKTMNNRQATSPRAEAVVRRLARNPGGSMDFRWFGISNEVDCWGRKTVTRRWHVIHCWTTDGKLFALGPHFTGPVEQNQGAANGDMKSFRLTRAEQHDNGIGQVEHGQAHHR